MDIEPLKALADDDDNRSIYTEDSREWARKWVTRIVIGFGLFLTLAHVIHG